MHKSKRISRILMLTTLAVASVTPVIAADRPNIIVVMADDMGFSDLGCYGGEIRTPTIDKLAAEGMRFSQFYNCNKCGPSRASLMTGCYPWKVGQKKGVSIFAKLTKNCATVMELLKGAGYSTCAVGRLDMVTGENWHDPKELSAVADRYLGVPTNGPGNFYKAVKGQPWFRNGKPFKRPTGVHSTDLISTFVADFIRETKGSEKPFFIYVSHFAPHWPLHADEKDIAPYREIYENKSRAELMDTRLMRLIESGLIPEGTELHQSMLKATGGGNVPAASERMAIHAAMVGGIDRGLGKAVAALEAAGKRDNTLILVLSDNGSSHQMVFSKPLKPGQRAGAMDTFINHGPAVASLNNTPFYNYKMMDYEGGIASPLVANWPRGLKNTGRISHRLSHIADIMPTCLELAGVTYPGLFNGRTLIRLAGKSLTPTFGDLAVLEGDDRILVFPNALRDGDWKLVTHKKPPELFRISTDRNERKNLAAEFPERLATMQMRHERVFAR
ncbi:MAG: arylsulfatase A-like enzyme [Rhodothermales bacterium]|jgi:arylsulfatase A-like enzyme